MRRADRRTGVRVGALLTAALVAGAAATFVGSTATPPATAQPAQCSNPKPNGDCPIGVELPVEQPGTPGNPGGPGGPDGGPTTPTTLDPNRCEWHTYPNQAHWRTVFPEAPPDAVFGEEHCFVNGDAIYGPYVPQWTVAGDAGFGAAPPTPAEVAQTLLVEVEALLRQPTVATDPPAGEPSLIDVPTFVEVTNWQGPIERSNCLLGVCVELTAAPTLTFTPGEPGAETIECDPPGTRYDPNGSEPDEQAAADGACAHIYERRTGVAGRPAAWPGEVTITWEITWAGAGDEGEFDPIAMTTEVPRAVQEAPTVVTDVGGGG
jgi:hypothetical protein